MISSTFFQELFTGNVQGDFSPGTGSAKQGGQTQSGFSTVLNQVMNGAKDSSDTTVSAPGGHRFLERLKKAIMASGVSLEDSQVNTDAMAEFQKLLIKAGFNKIEVQEMISGLTSGASGKGISLATLFTRASQLSEPDEGGDASVFLEISSLPYIEKILGQLGMDAESIRSVLADAKVEGSGIDIGKLAAGIRRAMAAGNGSTGNASGDTDDILDMMQRIGLMENDTESLATVLDKMISELSRLNKKSADLTEEVSGSLLIPYLQQLATSFGSDGEELLKMIRSAGNGGEGFDGAALLSKLVQMRQELSTAPGMKRLSDISGEMSLSRFVSALEARISAGHQMHNMLEEKASGQSIARGVDKFLEKIASGSAGVEQGYDKEVLMRDVRQTGEKPTAGANGKEGQGQNILNATRQASPGGDTGGNTAENSSGKDEAAKFMDSLASAGKQKVKNTTEQNLSAADGFMKAVKSAEEVSGSVKTPANRTLPGYLLDQVSRQIVKLRVAGENEITLQLKPPHLGRMKLSIEQTSGGMKVGIVVESAAAKEMLLSNTGELKAALGDQGLRLDKIDVETQGDFGRSMAQAGREFGQSAGQSGRQTGRGMSGSAPIQEELDLSEAIRAVDAGRLDLVA
jgi:flagellar hook-length control protein FliK